MSSTMPPPKLGSGLAVSKANVPICSAARASQRVAPRASGFVSSLTSGSRSGVNSSLFVRGVRNGAGRMRLESSPGICFV